MRLILAVDALVPPLTGIGRYAWELSTHYQTNRHNFDSMRFFFADQWVSDPSVMSQMPFVNTIMSRRERKIFPFRKIVHKWRMQRDIRNHVFHSPNYFLPESVDSGIVTVHDLSVFKYRETHPIERIKHFERGFASTLSRATHLITDSEATRGEIVDYFGWSPNRITAIKLGARREFHPRGEAEISAALSERGLAYGGYSLCVSTLEPRKRIDRLLAAYMDLPSSLRSTYPLVLAGSSGWLNNTLGEKIERGKREGWLLYLGFVEEAFLPLLYAGARAFFFPSIYEGFGLPVLEAMASGVPTLTSNSSSLPEVAGGAAWLVEPDDHDLLREGIEHVLCDELWRGAAVTRGLHVASSMTWDLCAKQTLDVCRRFA